VQDIETLALQTYQNNMSYFQEHYKELHSKLSALDLLLNDGRYPAQYDLEYKDSYFDVKELASNHYLYSENPDLLTQKLLKEVNFKKDNNVVETFYNMSFNDSAMEKIKEGNGVTLHATTAPIIQYCNDNVSAQMQMKDIYKYMLIGTGLGIHFDAITDKVKANVYFIIEKSLELFRLSLFVTDYSKVFANKTLFFSVGESDAEFKITFDAFYLHAFIRNHYLKFTLFDARHSDIIQLIQTTIVSRPEIAYPHEYLLHKNIQILQRINKNYAFMDFTQKTEATPFSTKPLLIIAAGPSLKKEIEWLKDNHQRYVIVAAIAALKTLVKYDITPNIVIQIDEKIPETERLLQSFENFDFLKDVFFIFSASVPQMLFDTFDKRQIVLLEDRTRYKLNNAFLEAASVGECAYAIALILNAKEIYLLGLDLALDAKSGQTHSSDHHLGKTIDLSQNHNDNSVASLTDSLMYIKGNFREQVPTTPLLYQSIPILNKYTTTLKRSDQNVYNLNDGAYFDQTIALQAKDISKDKYPPLNVPTLQQEILDFFTNASQTKLTQEEVISFSQRKAALAEMRRLIGIFNTTKVTSNEAFTQLYIDLLQQFLTSEVNEFKEIVTVYFLRIGAYVTDMFNTKELTNPKRHIKKMQKIVGVQLSKIIDTYEDALDKSMAELDSSKR